MRNPTRKVAIGLAALLVAGCGGEPDEPGSASPPQEPPTESEQDPDESAPAPGMDDFDRDRERSQAEEHLGAPEDEIEESETVRIVRRGEEDLPVTMDLRPGRHNLELDDTDEGWVVTRVVVEVPDGEDELVVE